MFRFILVLLLSLSTMAAAAEAGRAGPKRRPEPAAKPATGGPIPRFLYIEGTITPHAMRPIHAELMRIVRDESEAPITIVLNSGGGSVLAGMESINVMKAIQARGIVINCYVLDMAASMAFQIFTQCTNRYALPGSFLLWHGVRIRTQEPLTTESSKRISEDLRLVDILILDQLQTTLGMEKKQVLKHFDAESLWTGVALKQHTPYFLQVLPAYKNILRKLHRAIRTDDTPMFFMFGGDAGDSVRTEASRIPALWLEWSPGVGVIGE